MKLSAATLRDILSGRRGGIAAGCFRLAALLAEQPVGWYVARRNQRYDTGRETIHRVAAPVISVGNLTVGGTGKTPMVQWLADFFSSRSQPVVLISRGYGAKPGRVNDEALELAAKLPNVPHLQNPDRVATAREAVQSFPGSILLLDDAMQHRRLHRDLDIVLLDALEPFGYEHLLPRGLLREPIESLRRAQVVVLSRADLVEEATRRRIEERVRSIAPQAAWAEAVHEPSGLLNSAGEMKKLGDLSGCRVAAFCGIGNPEGFRRTLEKHRLNVVSFREFPDHHRYDSADQQALEAWLRGMKDVAAVLCTHKDLVKIPQAALGNVPLWAVTIGLRFLSGQTSLEKALGAAVGSSTLI